MRPCTTIGDDPAFLEKLARAIENGSRLEKELIASRLQMAAYKLRELEKVLVAQWVGAMRKLAEYEEKERG